MTGRIEKGIGGFYYVRDSRGTVYECKPRGILRNEKIRPVPGDMVEFEPLDEETETGSILSVHPRKNELLRPAVVNVDQSLIIFAAADPQPGFNLLDRFLLMMEGQGLPAIICFNKSDLVSDAETERIREIYRGSGCELFFLSVRENRGLDALRELLDRKVTVLAGPSGVGKSSLLNALKPEAAMETGEISRKLKRGKHTTRHSELFYLWEETFIMDTPGFTSLNVEGIRSEELRFQYPEFTEPAKACRFLDCVHMGEKECGVKQAVKDGSISRVRFENYQLIYQELKNKERY